MLINCATDDKAHAVHLSRLTNAMKSFEGYIMSACATSDNLNITLLLHSRVPPRVQRDCTGGFCDIETSASALDTHDQNRGLGFCLEGMESFLASCGAHFSMKLYDISMSIDNSS